MSWHGFVATAGVKLVHLTLLTFGLPVSEIPICFSCSCKDKRLPCSRAARAF